MQNNTNTAHVSAKDLSVSFGKVDVLKKLNLEINKGEFLVLLGASGCGKSTLLNTFAGLQEATDGDVWIDDRNVTFMEPKDRGIAMVFQSYALYPKMTVRGNLSFGLKMNKTPKDKINELVAYAARVLQIENLLDRKPGELSGGQRQRVAIGRALVRKADVFLFDEPLSNLDAKLRSELRVELKRLHEELGATMIYVTHDQVEALTLADRIAVMKAGVIQQLGTPDQIYKEPATRYVAQFVGMPSMNFVTGKIINTSGGTYFENGDIKFSIDEYISKQPLRDGQTVELGIRPEHVVLDTDGSTTFNVDIIEKLGSELIVWGKVGSTSLTLRAEPESSVASKEVRKISFKISGLNFFDPETGLRL
ncbi:ABC transporter ATP-binding protein [Kiloniella spongiae]|uniref:ABC transporter ATP-binding protein n=1 Tax=Kiloniella spongiae TaxID=1489064 RepID=A0A0H2MBH9_9PROT|nr:sn-glycerol-3-phosphate ABC transporter ATP-binding protein UgpC [Kiloniella spongiae]KLN59693.1 ABC transporter ATP-binding protein [Kiloniella spongiae]